MASPARDGRPLPSHALPLVEGAARGELVLQRCPSCGVIPSFPRIACPRCMGELEWFQASGRGVVRSFTVVRRPHHERFFEHVPIVMAAIELEEGSETISTIVGDDRLEVAVGSRVTVTSEDRWSPLPQYRLDD